MDEQAILEIGNLIRVRYKGWIKRIELIPEEIIETHEYGQFKKDYPRLCELAESDWEED